MKRYNPSELVYNYLNDDPKAGVRVSKLPPALKRKLTIDSVQTIAGGIKRNLNLVEGSILDPEAYGDDISPHQVAKSAAEETHRFIINDILFDVLPTQIGVQYNTHNFTSNTIRSQGPVKVKTGRGVISIQAQLVFVGIDEINNKLRRLIAQARIFPIWYIENEYIRTNVYPEDSKKNIAVVLNAMNISTHPEAVDTLVASLSMEVFNWEVYSRNFFFISEAILDNKSNFSNFSATKSAVSPLYSNMFSSYWDAILNHEGKLEVNLKTDSKAIKELKETLNFKLYETPNSFKFPKVNSGDFSSASNLSISYNSYKIIPEEVINQLVVSQKDTTTTTSPQIGEIDRAKKELGLTSIPEHKVTIYEASPILRKTKELNLVSYRTILNKAKQFAGLPYKQDPNREATTHFDCSSLVYNTLKEYNIFLGTFTGSQRFNLNKIYKEAEVSGTMEQLLLPIGRDPSNMKGKLLFCFKDAYSYDQKKLAQLKNESRIFQNADGIERHVGHVAFIDDVIKNKDGSYSIKLFHAYRPKVGITGSGGVRGYSYFEVYPIPGVNYDQTSNDIAPAVKKEIQNLYKKVNELAGRDSVARATPKTKPEASIALYDASKEFGRKLVKGLNKWLSKQKQWKLVWLRNGTFLLEKSNTFIVDSERNYPSIGYAAPASFVPGPVVQSISMSINNTFARLPMIGHELVTHQYMGGGDCTIQIHIASLGSQFVSELQMIRKYTENAARAFRYLDDIGTLKIRNPLIQLCGSEKFIIESIETRTNQESPDLYDITISLSEMRNNPRDSEEIKQELTQTQNIRNKFLEALIKGKNNSKDSVGNFVIVLSQALKTIYSGSEFGSTIYSSAKRPLIVGTSDNPIPNNNLNKEVKPQSSLKKDLSAYSFKTKEDFLRTLIHGVLNELIGYALPAFQILGITENDLKQWSNDSKHPLYSFGIFEKIERKLFFDKNYIGNKFGETIIKNNPKISFAYASENYDLLQSIRNTDQTQGIFATFSNYSRDSMLYHLEEINLTFLQLVQQRKFLLEIPYSGTTLLTQAADKYAEFLSFVQDLSVNTVASIYSLIDNLENLLQVHELEAFNKVIGSKYSEARSLLSFLKVEKNITAVGLVDTKNQLKMNLKLRSSLAEENNKDVAKKKAQMVLIGLFSQFRAAVYRLSDIGINAMKYSDKYGDIVYNLSGEDLLYHGLPAYQDIPCPVLDLSDSKYGSLRAGLREMDMPSTFYLNPDFYFFNEADADDLNLKRITNSLDSAKRLLNANYILAQGFGILPKREGSGNATWGPFAARGGDSNSEFNSNKTIQGKAESDLKANNLPDLMGLYFPTLIGRTIEKGLSTKIKDKGVRPLGLNDRNNADSSNPLNPELVEKAKSGDNFKFNPLLPNLEAVSFGPIGGIESRLGVFLDRSPQNSLQFYESDFIRNKRNPYKIRRALPAVKLYFIEDDTSGFGGLDQSSYIKSFDDFFSYRALKEIKLIKSRKFPASHLIVRVSNIYGNLDSLQFSQGGTVDYKRQDITSDSAVENLNYEKNNTELEHPFSRFILKEGIRVQLKGGFENNPGLMKTVFNGQIVQINQVAGDEIMIVCQDFGTQLVADIKGQTKSSISHKWIDTFDLLSYLICQPEMTYFGRWTLDSTRSVGESRSKGGWEKVFKFLTDPRDDNLFAPTRENMISAFSDTTGGIFSYLAFSVLNTLKSNSTEIDVGGEKLKARRINNIAGRDIYKIDILNLNASKTQKLFSVTAPATTISDASGKAVAKSTPTLSIGGVLAYEYGRGDAGYKGLDYHIYRSTIWDIFKEMELRHPGWIGHPVNYGNRMTMFFGQPTQPYWSRPPTPYEAREIYLTNKELKQKQDSNKIFTSLQKQINDKKGSFSYQWAVGASFVKEYAWTAFDWITTGLSIYATFKTGGAALGAQWVGKQIAKNALKGIGIALLTYGVTSSSGQGSWTDIIGSLGVGLTGAFAAGTGSITKTIAKSTFATKTGKFLGISAAAAAVIGGITSLTSTSNLNSLLFLQSELRNKLSQQIMKKKLSGRLKQFRNYHIVNTKNHIIANEIKSTVNNTYNAVTVEYTEDDKKDLDSKGIDTARRATRTVKASHRILDKDIKMGFLPYPNCRGLWMADRYAQGLLMRYMKDAYQGQLLVLGDWEYEPYDRVMIEDDYLGMYGQIEIEQVVTTLSPDVGFVTEITPDMVIYGNQIVDMMYDNYMSGAMAWYDMSWSEAINAILKNDPSAYFEKMGISKQVDGVISGRGVANTKNPNGLSEVEARLLNSAPTLLGLGVLTLGGIGYAGVTAAAAETTAGAVAASNVPLTIAGVSSVAGFTGAYAGLFGEPILNKVDGPNKARSSFASGSNALTYLKFKLFGSMALKFYEWSTSRQPLIFEPLFLNGKPLLPSIDLDKVSMVQNIKDNFIPIAGNLARGFEILKESGRQFVFGELADKINRTPS